MTTQRSLPRYRIMTRKPGQRLFKFIRFTGSSGTDRARLAEVMERERARAPEGWEFAIARQLVVTIESDWVVES